MNKKPLTGVNLGGWLVLEKWLTPSLFAGTHAVDEYSLSVVPGAAKHLKTFRDNFITEEDFVWLAGQGVELVRLPVGFWVFGDAAPYTSTVEYVDQAFAWGAKHGLKILLDLHAAPGSQNGNDHSGQAGSIGWCSPDADKFCDQTLAVLARLCERYGQESALWGIEVVNEPSPKITTRRLADFYRRGYQLVVGSCAPGTFVVAHDAFRPWRWFVRLPRWRYPQLIIDHHHYQLFAPIDQRLSPAQQLRRTARSVRWQLGIARWFHATMIGEWSLALPAVQMKSLRSAAQANVTAAFGLAQGRAFRGQVSTCFWTYKTQDATSWDFRACHQRGWLA